MLLRLKSKIKYEILPPMFLDMYRRIKNFSPRSGILCRGNAGLKGIHKGKRCFILCNGPSVNRQNLLPLKDEIVFSVSSGYHHKDYSVISPRYHCVPRLIYSSCFTVDTAIAWFKEMDHGTADAELFLDAANEPLVRRYGLFGGRIINYLYTGISFSDKMSKVIDITRIIPGPQSAPIMCLMVAMYMGFDKIYLIGTEHDSGVTGEYKYFYTPKLMRGADPNVDLNGKVKDVKVAQLAIRNLMAQYEAIKSIADSERIGIYNATLGGALEVFPRVNLPDILRKV